MFTIETLLVAASAAMLGLTLLLLSRERRRVRARRYGDGEDEGQTFAGLPGCGEGSGCDTVLSSRWSRLGPAPVALPGALLYAALLAAALLSHPAATPSPPPGSLALAATLALTAGAAAAWFILVQAIVLRRFCPYCTAIHLLALVAAGGGVAMGVPGWGWAAAGGATALLVLAQAAARPGPTFAVETVGAGASASEPEPEADDPAAPAAPARSRYVAFAGGKVRLPREDTPRLGPADAPLELAFLFDYTCETCRHMHGLLLEAVARSAGRLAAYLLPLPQEPSCNPLIRHELPEHRDACKYARLMLGLWDAAPQHLEAYERWFMAQAGQPTYEACRDQALALAGPDVDLHRDPSFAAARITDAIDAYRAVKTGRVPAILMPRAVMAGRVETVEELLRVLARAQAEGGGAR